MKLHTTEQAIIETEDLALEIRNLLRSKGWRYHYDDTIKMWVWQKKLTDGRTILVGGGDDRLALSYEQAMST